MSAAATDNKEDTMQYNEMQVGDKVEITDKRTVTISKIDAHANAYDQNGKVIMANGPHYPHTREFGLIERPVPDLPTKLGSIISVPHENPFAEHEEFVLIPGLYSPAVWRGIPSTASRNPREMAAQVKARGGFKVIR
ncbi:hypothetical protein SEA_DUSTYDINO_114 [Microbacterium phage DustyDino]|nr:hypothetical protein SEA_DUSTYDINO_114 [Microbacterium phage DustyDino]UVK62524.1 hypothetical protein SEA_YUMA_109 [Microbacterium phage Yuma]WNO26001.1 hypothetical protein SEA_ASEGATO_109 [Microbacterium phage ASegato]